MTAERQIFFFGGSAPSNGIIYILYIYIYIPEKGGRKPAAARRVSLFLAGVAAQDTWSAACEAAVPRMRGAYVMVIEGAEKQAGRLWDKFGMKDVVRNAIRCMLA